MKVINVVGARPNMMKIAPIIEAMKKYSKFNHVFLHTGQHYDRSMSKAFFVDLCLPKPDIYLGVGSGSHAEQTAKIIRRFEKVLYSERPDLVIVVGDVNSTMACAITAAKLNIPVAHIEAGYRSFDRTMPEELNRIITDSISTYLFATSEDAVNNLKNEGIKDERTFLVGNVMIDTLLKYKKKAESCDVLRRLNLESQEFAVLTLHRPSNVDRREDFAAILRAIKDIQEQIKIIFPIHPRTKNMLKRHGFLRYVARLKNFIITEPLGYLEFLKLISEAKFVLTDSGGIQEETTVLQVPCLTLRNNTERPVTVTEGTNVIVGNNYAKIITQARIIINGKFPKIGKIPKFWDGRAAQRIISVLRKV